MKVWELVEKLAKLGMDNEVYIRESNVITRYQTHSTLAGLSL